MTITLAELARALDGRLWGDGALRITGAAEPADAGTATGGSAVIAMAMTPQYAAALAPGAAAMIAEGMDPEALGLSGAVIVPRPRLAMAGLTCALDPGPRIAPGIHPTAVVDPSAEIGEGAAVGPFVVIGAGVRLGARARIDAHASIGAGSVIGEDALIHAGVRIAHGITAGAQLVVQPGAVIGGDGFSFVTPETSGIEEIRATLGHRDEIRDQHWVRIHSLGGVVLGDDVEVGANSTIDRGTIRATSIGSGTKIDNLVQVGHNVRIGRDCLLCGLVGIAGSVRIGDRVVLAGKTGVSDNIFIGDDVIAGGGSNIFTNVPAGRVILGSPATKMDTHPHADHVMASAHLKARTGAPNAIGEKVRDIAAIWAGLYNMPGAFDPARDFDRLFAEGETFRIGELEVRVMLSPGHTLGSVTYVCGDAAFVHDTLMQPDVGTSRADFPGGNTGQLWDSIQAILALPPQTRVFVGHDYGTDSRDEPMWEATVAEHLARNKHVKAGTRREDWIRRRNERDTTLPLPDRILAALQVNLRGGRLPPAEDDGHAYLKLPVNRF